MPDRVARMKPPPKTEEPYAPAAAESGEQARRNDAPDFARMGLRVYRVPVGGLHPGYKLQDDSDQATNTSPSQQQPARLIGQRRWPGDAVALCKIHTDAPQQAQYLVILHKLGNGL